MNVWITKYALTQGIFVIEAEECGNNMVRGKVTGALYPTYYHGEGREWHRTKEAAVLKAEDMRKKKIESLKKQIKKLETMKFD